MQLTFSGTIYLKTILILIQKSRLNMKKKKKITMNLKYNLQNYVKYDKIII